MKTFLLILPIALMATLVEAKQDDFDRLVAEEGASSFKKTEAARDAGGADGHAHVARESRGTVEDTAAAKAETQRDSAAADSRVAQDSARAARATQEAAGYTVADTAEDDAVTKQDTVAAEARVEHD